MDAWADHPVEIVLRDKASGQEVRFQSGEIWITVEHPDPLYRLEFDDPLSVPIEKLRERRVTIEAEFLAAFRRAEDPMSRLQERRQIGGE